MAKKIKPGHKRCPSCKALVSGPRTKICPKCGHEFNGKPQEVPALATAPAKPTKNGGTVTFDKLQANKTQAVRDHLEAHPEAMNGEIAAALNKQGIDITARHVSNIKAKLKQAGTVKKVAKPASEVAPVLAAVEKPTKNGGTITLEQVKKVAHTVKTLGGLQRATEVLEVIKELGGAKKFKELAEAMTIAVTDDIPY